MLSLEHAKLVESVIADLLQFLFVLGVNTLLDILPLVTGQVACVTLSLGKELVRVNVDVIVLLKVVILRDLAVLILALNAIVGRLIVAASDDDARAQLLLRVHILPVEVETARRHDMSVLLLLTSSSVGLRANDGSLVEITLIDIGLGRLDDDLVGALIQRHSLHGVELILLLLLVIRIIGLLSLLDGLHVNTRETGAHILISIRRSEALVHLLLRLLRGHTNYRSLLGRIILLLNGSGSHGLLLIDRLRSHLRLHVRHGLLLLHWLVWRHLWLSVLRLLPLLLGLHAGLLCVQGRAHSRLLHLLLRHVALRHGSLLQRLGSQGLLHLRRLLSVGLLRLCRKLVRVDLSGGTLLIIVQRLTELVDLLLRLHLSVRQLLLGLRRHVSRLLLRRHGVKVRERTLRLMPLLLLVLWLHVVLNYWIKWLRR